MAGGGLMQLVAYGAQDIYLTGDPQITFFKVVYRRHTNFSMESISQTFSGTQSFGGKSTVVVSRNGDLVTRALLEVDLPAVSGMHVASSSGFSWVREIGHFLIKNVQVDIGGQQIDKHYGEWLSIWNALTIPSEKLDGYNNMIGNVASVYTGATPADGAPGSGHISSRRLYIPLQFWFNRNPGLALPLIALQFHEVKFQFEFRSVGDLYRGAVDGSNTTSASSLSLSNMELWLDYIYLDTDERRRFAKTAHEYLIEQLQYHGEESFPSGQSSASFRLNFNHPVKFLAWTVQLDTSKNTANRDTLDYTNYTGSTVDVAAYYPMGTGAGGADAADAIEDVGDVVDNTNASLVSVARLVLNGHDRMAERRGDYYRWVQPYYHFPRIPMYAISVYSFALHPCEHQPSGTANLSRIDNATLYVTSTGSATQSIKVFAVNYNVLRITSGMGGVAFSN